MSLFQSGPPSGPRPKCHFPTTPVLYPAFFNTEAMVSLPGSIIMAAFPRATPVPFFLHAYDPVSMENLEGVQVADEV